MIVDQHVKRPCTAAQGEAAPTAASGRAQAPNLSVLSGIITGMETKAPDAPSGTSKAESASPPDPTAGAGKKTPRDTSNISIGGQ
jgi:hypothetical protein